MSEGKTSILPVNIERRRMTVARKQSGTKDDVKF